MTTDQPDVEIDELLWNVYDAGAKSMEDSGGNDQEVNEAKAALHSMLIEAENRGGVRALNELIDTELPWPEDVFGHVPEDEWPKIDEFAKTRGYRIDTIGATLMSRGWLNLVRIAKEMKSELTNKQEGEGV